MLYIVTGKTLL